MMCVSMFPSVRLAVCVSSCWMRCWRVDIRMFARPCACGMVCDAFGAEAGFSLCRCCAALLCSILCWYWDSVPRACQVCISELSVLPQSEVSHGGETERCKKMCFPGRFVRSRGAGLPFLMMHTWCPPVWVGQGSRASDHLGNRTSCEHFKNVRHFARETLCM